MLVIRLQRVGKKKQASFRVVLQDHTWSPKGKAMELLGFYDPLHKHRTFQEERIKFWISKGARPSATVHNLFVDAKLVEGEKVSAWTPKKRKGKEAEKAAAETAGAEPTAESSDDSLDKSSDQAAMKSQEAMKPASTEGALPESQEKTEAEEKTDESADEQEKKEPSETPEVSPTAKA
jgi:small subunit ribosomal protein S16